MIITQNPVSYSGSSLNHDGKGNSRILLSSTNFQHRTPNEPLNGTVYNHESDFAVRETRSNSSSHSNVSFHRYNFQSFLPYVNFKLCGMCFLWYSSSVVSNNSTKQILRQFSYPVTLTEFQFLLNAFFCLITILVVNQNDSRVYKTSSKMSKRFPPGTFPKDIDSASFTLKGSFLTIKRNILSTTIPMGMFQFLGHITGHKATSIIPVSLVHTIKALSPIVTVVAYRLVFHKHYPIKTYLTLIPLVSGVMLSCLKNNLSINNELFFQGCLFAFISMLIFVSQNIFAKKALTFRENQLNGDSNSKLKGDDDTILPQYKNSENNKPEKFDKLTILFYCSIIGFSLTLPLYVILESNVFVQQKTLSLFQLTPGLMFLLILNGFAHFCQSLVAFQILGMISPINYSIANIMKRITIIGFSIFWETTKLNNVQWCGLVLTIIGLYSYDKWGTVKN
ncbi:BA75_02721T0 [Komagataella pastoris]|uniref:BA75_02721T0 n=1 Tax=Komagataella pastoris TaxID=4922 RepID=A0A1B2JA27_PICPA|nr:BA75_02721T0 [Komagataella pastoris]